jgi:hypothetical protein
MLVTMVSGASASGASTSVSFVQGTTFDTGKVASTIVSLTKPVNAGDLLVGWFAQYAVAGSVTVSDNVNGTWTRAPSSVQFGGSKGDIALYYLAGAKAAAGGIAITVSASAAANFQGTVAEYSGVAASGPLVGMAVARGSSSAVNSGATSSVPAGQLVYAAEVTGVSPVRCRPRAAAEESPTPNGRARPAGRRSRRTSPAARPAPRPEPPRWPRVPTGTR